MLLKMPSSFPNSFRPGRPFVRGFFCVDTSSSTKWRLKYGLLYAGLTSRFTAALVGPDDALVFNQDDNSELKRAFYEAVLGVKFEVETLPD